MTENSGENSDRPAHLFKPGQSGNPAGKPRGTKHRATRLVEELLHGEAETLVRKMVNLAKAGDTIALKWTLDRLCPRPKSAPIAIELPAIKTAHDAANAMTTITQALASGEIDGDQAAALQSAVAATVRTIETAEIETRLAAIEAALKPRKATG